jgi:hypothetical protein
MSSYSNSCSSLYRDVYNAVDCYEFATVAEMNGVSGAVPIPASTAQRFYQTPSVVSAQGQVENPIAPEVAQAAATVAQATGIPAAAVAQFIRSNRRF